MPEKCPKCGAELHNTHKERGRIKELWRCWSFRYDGGVFVQTDQCRIRELTAEVGRLTKENAALCAMVEDWRLKPAEKNPDPTGDSLVDRLRGIYVVLVNDGAGLLNGKGTFTRCFPVGSINLKAADEIEALREELKSLASPPHTR